MHSNMKHKQQGIAIGAILLVVTLLGLVGWAVAAMTKGASAGSADAQTNSTLASTIRYQAAQLEIGFERMLAGGHAKNQILFTTDSTHGLFNGTVGAVGSQLPPMQAFATAPTIANAQDPWTYATGATFTGSSNTAAVKLAGLSLTTCNALNTAIGVAANINSGTPLAGATMAAAVTAGAVGSEFCYNDGTTGYTFVRGVY